MKILKKFDSYIKEDLEMMAEPSNPSTSPSPSTPTVEPGTKPARRDRPSPIRRDRPAIEPDPQAKMKTDFTEEEGEYIGNELLKDLAKKLGTEVVDGSINYNGNKIDFYSETEMFHIGKKKFKNVEDVIDYLSSEGVIKNITHEDELEEFEDIEDELEIKESKFTKRFNDFR